MCEALESIVKSCDNNSGGISNIWINQQDNIDTFTLDGTNTWTIDSITLNVGAPDYTAFEIRRNTGSYTEEAAIDLVNGSSYVTATISLMFHRRDQDKSQAIKILGAGQQYLDRKQDSQETRFLQSKGVDVFSYPLQATLLPDTVRRDSLSVVNANLKMVRCNDYIVFANGSQVQYVLGSRTWGSTTTCTYDTTTYASNAPGTLTAPTVINDITSNDSYVFVATDTGIWFCQIGVSSSFKIFASNDITTGYTAGYDMVRDRKSTRLNSSHIPLSRMPSSA